jgi:hypothetical protein
MNNVFSIIFYVMIALIVYFCAASYDKSVDCSNNAVISIYIPIVIVVIILLALL